jgi:peptide/nickel transport system substrate-binding protein
MFGYDETIPTYEFDLTAAKEYLENATNEATTNSWWEDGFNIALFYNSGNTYRETACLYIEDALAQLTEMSADEGGTATFGAQVNTLDWAKYLELLRTIKPTPFPMFYLGWAPDYADPDDYATPFLDSDYGTFPHTTSYVNETINDLIRDAAVELDVDLRADMYSELAQLVYEDAPYIWLWQGNNFHIERSWVSGYYFNPMYAGFYYSAFSKG